MELRGFYEGSMQWNQLVRSLKINHIENVLVKVEAVYLLTNACVSSKRLQIHQDKHQRVTTSRNSCRRQQFCLNHQKRRAPEIILITQLNQETEILFIIKSLVTVEPHVAFTKNGLRFFEIASLIFSSKSSTSI